jgi:lipopolysaccharide assembly protein A
MRWIYLAVIILFAVSTLKLRNDTVVDSRFWRAKIRVETLIFALQNLESTTVSFLSFRVRAPLAVLTILVYLLGAATGGSLLALLRRSYQRSPTFRGSA